MNKSQRKVIIAGNWKMNKTAKQSKELLSEIIDVVPNYDDCTVIICPPAINIQSCCAVAKDSHVAIGAQNCHFEASGAYTAEISAEMLKDFDVKYSIIGHSERRQYFAETDETVNKRVATCLANDITPLFCIGENLEERETGITNNVMHTQVTKGLLNVSKEDVLNVVVAYEPVWAIGTGKTATSEQAQETCAYIRSVLADMYDAETAQKVSILYGGSMNAANAAELLSMEDIDGGLIGGASLKPNDFASIVKATK